MKIPVPDNAKLNFYGNGWECRTGFLKDRNQCVAIIIPDNAKEKPQRGTVVAAGPGTKDEPITVKIGDTVLYGKYAGTELKLEGKDYLIMRESDILAIV